MFKAHHTAEVTRARDAGAVAKARVKKDRKPSGKTKVCRTCKGEKPIKAFDGHHHSADGHRHDCRDCVAAGKAKKRPAPSAEAKAVAKAQRAQPHRRAANAKSVRAWKRRNADAVIAHHAVEKALKTGVLARPKVCQVEACRTRERLNGHHRDN